MPRHAARPTLIDTLLAYVTLVVGYLRLTATVGKHAFRPSASRVRAEFGADDQWAADLSSMKDSMASTAVMPAVPCVWPVVDPDAPTVRTEVRA